MKVSINAFSTELKNIRTGRVSPDILKTIIVDSYGSKTPLTQLSNINNLDNMTLNINIWDSSLVKTIEKNILDSNLGVTPQTDGNNILLKFPELTAVNSGNFKSILLPSVCGVTPKFESNIFFSIVLTNEESQIFIFKVILSRLLIFESCVKGVFDP